MFDPVSWVIFGIIGGKYFMDSAIRVGRREVIEELEKEVAARRRREQELRTEKRIRDKPKPPPSKQESMENLAKHLSLRKMRDKNFAGFKLAPYQIRQLAGTEIETWPEWVHEWMKLSLKSDEDYWSWMKEQERSKQKQLEKKSLLRRFLDWGSVEWP